MEDGYRNFFRQGISQQLIKRYFYCNSKFTKNLKTATARN